MIYRCDWKCRKGKCSTNFRGWKNAGKVMYDETMSVYKLEMLVPYVRTCLSI